MMFFIFMMVLWSTIIICGTLESIDGKLEALIKKL